MQPDGITYKCKACDDFFCSGPIPMQAHLNGKSHQKKVKLRGSASLNGSSLAQSPIRIFTQPKQSYQIPVEERVENAWKHTTMCGYEYNDLFSQLSVNAKIEELNPHFAFISKNDPIPNLVQYLSM